MGVNSERYFLQSIKVNPDPRTQNPKTTNPKSEIGVNPKKSIHKSIKVNPHLVYVSKFIV